MLLVSDQAGQATKKFLAFFQSFERRSIKVRVNVGEEIFVLKCTWPASEQSFKQNKDGGYAGKLTFVRKEHDFQACDANSPLR